MSEPPPRRPRIVERLLAGRERHRRRHPLVRATVAAAGFVVLAAGLVMLVTPGPAFVLIPVGLAILALEFTWAERLLARALAQAERARERARGTSPARRALAIAITAGALGAAVAAAIVWT